MIFAISLLIIIAIAMLFCFPAFTICAGILIWLVVAWKLDTNAANDLDQLYKEKEETRKKEDERRDKLKEKYDHSWILHLNDDYNNDVFGAKYYCDGM